VALMFFNGGAMRGEPLHHLLDGSPFVRVAETAPKYRFYAVGDQCPALYPVSHGGAPVVGEVYDVSLDDLRDKVLPSEPHELELGVVELADGSSAFAMLLRRPYTSHVALRDITEIGDWRAVKASA
jgi:gamma-glutamylcyclotransferase (GGCT)/AIG2-like uncharacterized protein YtfP